MLYRNNFKTNKAKYVKHLKQNTHTSLTKASGSTKSISRKIGQYQGSIGLSGEMGGMN